MESARDRINMNRTAYILCNRPWKDLYKSSYTPENDQDKYIVEIVERSKEREQYTSHLTHFWIR